MRTCKTEIIEDGPVSVVVLHLYFEEPEQFLTVRSDVRREALCSGPEYGGFGTDMTKAIQESERRANGIWNSGGRGSWDLRCVMGPSRHEGMPMAEWSEQKRPQDNLRKLAPP